MRDVRLVEVEFFDSIELDPDLVILLYYDTDLKFEIPLSCAPSRFFVSLVARHHCRSSTIHPPLLLFGVKKVLKTFIHLSGSVATLNNQAMSARSRVFSAYRRIFRARKELFQGDRQAMMESRAAIKTEFLKNRDAPSSGEHFEGLILMVDEAVDMLLHGIVRGDLNQDSGNYGELT